MKWKIKAMFETTNQYIYIQYIYTIYIYTTYIYIYNIYIHTIYIYNIYIYMLVYQLIYRLKNHSYVNVYQREDHSLSSCSPFNGCGYIPPARLASSQCHLQASAYAVDIPSPMDVFLWYSH